MVELTLGGFSVAAVMHYPPDAGLVNYYDPAARRGLLSPQALGITRAGTSKSDCHDPLGRQSPDPVEAL
jgi:hypothetical protein